ncbi:hypothetical protein B0H10DRAFT_2125763 [Mycena sp. CBHHK59/15]|nr:hypothetical protein B0H10DRAFT_2125763 [Mycena sp. CBHHK59/15]
MARQNNFLRALLTAFMSNSSLEPQRLASAARRLPPEIYLEISGYLDTWHVLKLSVTCSDFRNLLSPVLYHTMSLQSSEHCVSGLVMLSKFPTLCAQVKILSVHPKYTASGRMQDEAMVATMIESISYKLNNLVTFEWCGIGRPGDSLWTSLRNGCPGLKNIHLNTMSMDWAESRLLEFDNLLAFSLMISHPNLQPIPEKLLRQLYDMLCRCPNLRELAIPFSLGFPSKAWPNLCSVQLDMRATLISAQLLEAFLLRHPGIKVLAMKSFDTLQLAVYPTQLSSFDGSYSHALQLPNPESIQTLTLRKDRDTLISDVVAGLPQFKSLRRLSVDLIDIEVLAGVVSACLGVEQLSIIVPTWIHRLPDISTQLSRLLALSALTLCEARSPTTRKRQMLPSALALCEANPSLRQISFLWIMGEKCKRGSYHISQGRIEASERTRGPGLRGSYRRFSHHIRTE